MGTTASDTPAPVSLSAARSGSLAEYIRLARPMQWAKGAFVIVGPVYGLAIRDVSSALAVLGAFLAFGFASSACYVHNDIRDRELDKAHPRKRHRPIAAGRISAGSAYAFFVVLLLLAGAMLVLVPDTAPNIWRRELLAGSLVLYIANVLAYSTWLKHKAVADVISLSIGFVLRVLGGCAAVAIIPSSWLLNVTFFVSMFLAFGKRLGERRTMGSAASTTRGVQLKYTDDLLRMAMVVTGVATLITYAQYVQSQSDLYTRGFNLLWLTMLPATYCLLRAMVKVEVGEYDDPTDMATRDRPFQLAVAVFGAITLGLILWLRVPHGA
jgi:decaprenyl-phosphate phosphoribosyltransferase